MNRRTFLCGKCGRIRRRTNAWALDEAGPGWPVCCDTGMRLLHHTQAAAAAQLKPAERLEWLVLGALLYKRRMRGSHKWQAALTPARKRHALDQLDEIAKSGWRPRGPQVKKWKAQVERKKHAKKKNLR